MEHTGKQQVIYQINQKNFLQSLVQIEKGIEKCTFISIDLELGGIQAPKTSSSSMMDTIAQRYEQYRQSACSFPIVEFGMSLFTWKNQEKEFDVETFQFPIFPRPLLPQQDERLFMIQPKCLQYIRSHGFDLNYWIDEGISYLSHHDQLKQTTTGSSSSTINSTKELTINADTQRFIDDICHQAMDFFRLHKPQEEKQQDDDEEEELKRLLSTPCNGTGSSIQPNHFVTEALPPFRRQALCQYIKKTLVDLVVLELEADNNPCMETSITTTPPWKRCLRIIQPTSPLQKQLISQVYDEIVQQNKKLKEKELIGFTSIIDFISKSKKPLVGHNLFLDLMHCYEKFHQPLPLDSCVFIQELMSLLPCIYDTKEIVTQARKTLDFFNDRIEFTSLEQVFTSVSKDPFHGPPVKYKTTTCDTTKRVAHQAGYDAYMTGFVFTRLCSSALGISKDKMSTLASSDVLQQYRHVLHVSFFVPTFALCLNENKSKLIQPSRDKYVRIELTRVDRDKLKTFHIKQCVAYCLGISAGKIHLTWENRTRVYIELTDKEQVCKLMDIWQDTKKSHATNKHPIPSIGCVDLYLLDTNTTKSTDMSTDSGTKNKRIKKQQLSSSSSSSSQKKKRKYTI